MVRYQFGFYDPPYQRGADSMTPPIGGVLILENECMYIEQVLPFYFLDLIWYLNTLDTGITSIFIRLRTLNLQSRCERTGRIYIVSYKRKFTVRGTIYCIHYLTSNFFIASLTTWSDNIL